MFYRNLVKGAVDSALEKGKGVFNRVGVNVAHRIGSRSRLGPVGSIDAHVFRREVARPVARHGFARVQIDNE